MASIGSAAAASGQHSSPIYVYVNNWHPHYATATYVAQQAVASQLWHARLEGLVSASVCLVVAFTLTSAYLLVHQRRQATKQHVRIFSSGGQTDGTAPFSPKDSQETPRTADVSLDPEQGLTGDMFATQDLGRPLMEALHDVKSVTPVALGGGGVREVGLKRLGSRSGSGLGYTPCVGEGDSGLGLIALRTEDVYVVTLGATHELEQTPRESDPSVSSVGVSTTLGSEGHKALVTTPKSDVSSGRGGGPASPGGSSCLSSPRPSPPLKACCRQPLRPRLAGLRKRVPLCMSLSGLTLALLGLVLSTYVLVTGMFDPSPYYQQRYAYHT